MDTTELEKYRRYSCNSENYIEFCKREDENDYVVFSGEFNVPPDIAYRSNSDVLNLWKILNESTLWTREDVKEKDTEEYKFKVVIKKQETEANNSIKDFHDWLGE